MLAGAGKGDWEPEPNQITQPVGQGSQPGV